MDCGFPLPRLSTATTFENTQEVSDVEEVHVNYKTGASFIGTIKNHKKVGTGIFTWPNGSKYEGPFVENHRHGKGQLSHHGNICFILIICFNYIYILIYIYPHILQFFLYIGIKYY